ncbi:SAM-dependent methyltransferase [Epibacterium ulvae]|uniref:SAM-dependent methyltransferase n=1 Tax=Epibacterium ulvae TaxID=1156985 RepID=UPI0024922688|nr:cyclopropane-fatty-acyl-phospholipid synthase family protein [Epibacterium ulvae]
MRLTDKALKTKFLSTCETLPNGRLRLKTPDGQIYSFGNTGAEVDLDIRDWAAVSALAAHGQVGLGEAYVAGLWETSSIENLMVFALQNREQLGQFDKAGLLANARFRLVDRVLRSNTRKGSGRNIRAHYDVGNEFYQLWLDEGLTYSSGLFANSGTDLAQAQHDKNSRILSRLSSGERLLEIGCGWGGFAEQAADQGRDVTGVTVSPSQYSYADCRLDGKADIQLRDYRDVQGQYDNIVSVEMIEAVGERHWPSYFATLKRNLAESGRCVIQAITVRDSYFDTYRKTSDFIRQYVFPGGMLLSDQVIADQASRAGLAVRDNFAFGQDYAHTCRIWAERLQGQSRRIHALGHDESFLRTWQYYLEICAASFAVGHTNVVQVELAHA